MSKYSNEYKPQGKQCTKPNVSKYGAHPIQNLTNNKGDNTMTTKHEYTWKPREGKDVYPTDWENIDLDSHEAELNLVEPLSFEALLLEIACNCETIDRKSVEDQFLTDLQSRIDEAKEIFECNLDNIIAKAKAERAGK